MAKNMEKTENRHQQNYQARKSNLETKIAVHNLKPTFLALSL